MMDAYIDFVDGHYEDFIKIPRFASLISGNVPERVDGSEDEFFIICSNDGLELKFDSHNCLDVIMVYSPRFFEGNLANVTHKSDVRKILGEPSSTQPEKVVPVFGKIGAWDKYSHRDNKYIQISYILGSDVIERVDYAKESEY